MTNYSIFEREAMDMIKTHGFDRFFIYHIKLNFLAEWEIEEYAQYVLDELIYRQDFEDCALLLRELENYKERKARGFTLI